MRGGWLSFARQRARYATVQAGFDKRSTTAPHLLVALGFETSTSNARRKIGEGAVTVGPERTAVTDPRAPIDVADGLIVRVGKHKIARVRLQ